MKKKTHNAITEHYLIPAVLFLLNVAMAHLIYAFMEGSSHSFSYKVAVAVAFALLATSLLLKKQIHLTCSILFYAFVLLWF